MSSDMYENLKGELNKIFMEGDTLVDDDELWLDLISESMDSKRVLEMVRELKEIGNSYFKSGEFEEALEKYGYAEAILARFNFEEDCDKTECCDLALCILLNSAACFSKLKDFEQVGRVCSIILDFQPNNVKARYRRAMAAVELGRYEWAFWDLVSAAETNPKNQEVATLLAEVRDHIKRKKKKDQSQGECPKGLGIGLSPATKKSRDDMRIEIPSSHDNSQRNDLIVVERMDGEDNIKKLRHKEDKASSSSSEIMECEGYSEISEDSPERWSKQELDAGTVNDVTIVDNEDEGDAKRDMRNAEDNDNVCNLEAMKCERNVMVSEANSTIMSSKKNLDELMEDARSWHQASESSSTITDEVDASSSGCTNAEAKSYLAEPSHRFNNRKRQGSNLTISSSDYLLMTQGKTLKFYNAQLGSVMEIRIANKAVKQVTVERKAQSQESVGLMHDSHQTSIQEVKRLERDKPRDMDSEVGSCVSFEDNSREIVEDSDVSSSIMVFSSRAKKKICDMKPHISSKSPMKSNKRRRKVHSNAVPLSPTNFYCGCRYKVGQKRKCNHLVPLDFNHHPKKKLAPHNNWSRHSQYFADCNISGSIMDIASVTHG